MRRLLSLLAYKIRRYPIERRENLAAIRNLRVDLASGNEVRSGYVDHYTEDFELQTREKYRKTMQSSEPSELAFRLSYVRDRIFEFVPAGSTVFDFGCSYAWLAGQLRDYNFVGIDRNAEAMRRNKEEFPGATFIAGDVFEYLAANRIDVFCHLNIGVYFLPPFIRRLYEAARRAGARYIVGFEPSGKSRQTGQYFDYSTEPRETVVFRGKMLLNNYPALMSAAGFQVVHSAILRPPHPQKDFRSVCFVAAL